MTVALTCFADLKGAFDNVDPAIMLQTLTAAGLPSPLISLIADLYNGAVARQFDNGALDKVPIPLQKGIRQGCPLSPTLFNIFMSVVAKRLGDYAPAVKSQRYKSLNSLLYADDTTLVAHSPQDLQALMTLLHTICTQLHMTIDPLKTKVMIFNASPDERSNHDFHIGTTTIDCVATHKYLGIQLDSTMSTTVMQSARLKQAKAMLHKAHDFAAIADLKHMQSLTTLLSATIVQTALFGVEIWGPSELPGMDRLMNDIQLVMAQFLRRTLGLPRHTSTIVLQLESGQKSAFTYCMRRCTAFISRCSTGDDPLLAAMVRDLQHMHGWNNFIVNVMNTSHTSPDPESGTPAPRMRAPTSRSNPHAIHSLPPAAIMDALPALYREDLGKYLRDTPHNAQAEHRITSTYVQDIWNGKFAINSHTRHAFYSVWDAPRATYRAWIRTRTLTLCLPAYHEDPGDILPTFPQRLCLLSCNRPGDLRHWALQCTPVLHEIRSKFPNIQYPPASLKALFGDLYETRTLASVIHTLYWLLIEVTTID